ncbi:hypothetical protein [Mongoliibacter ruber]|uniref:Uncharacterized protein n=1 Tax=Mongoliibacter ruber TaxID=1750599 RepID=A0A2T0WV55_9BACT|nr:hypothetical protein [Mongoliibacter ruber]PRY90583.1 hypothetical protein CLW00_101246 [Mongoliibacter ruber]
MKNFEKNYIGKGKKIQNLDIVRVTISKAKLEELIANDLVKYGDNEYLVFEVAALKEEDDYKRTHTAYISKKVEEEKKPSKRKTAKA